MVILGQSKRPEEREFDLRTAIHERWSRRELERQMDAALFERIVLSPVKVSPAARQIDPRTESFFKDAYMLGFLNLPANHTEGNLHGGLLLKLKEFLIELGRDLLRRFGVPRSGWKTRLCVRPSVLSPRAELPSSDRTQSGPVRT